jgi:hypothetical protein
LQKKRYGTIYLYDESIIHPSIGLYLYSPESILEMIVGLKLTTSSLQVLFMLVVSLKQLLVKQTSSFVVVVPTTRSRLVRPAAFSSSVIRMTSSSSSSSSSNIEPPITRRDEERYILAGKLNPSDPGYYDPNKLKNNIKEPLLRQAIGSNEKLLDPP